MDNDQQQALGAEVPKTDPQAAPQGDQASSGDTGNEQAASSQADAAAGVIAGGSSAADGILAEAEKVAGEVVDWVEHEAALLAFEANAGLTWIRTKLGDGRIGDLSRHGEFRATATAE